MARGTLVARRRRRPDAAAAGRRAPQRLDLGRASARPVAAERQVAQPQRAERRPARAARRGARPPRTSAAPGACAPRGSPARAGRARAGARAPGAVSRPRARRPRAAAAAPARAPAGGGPDAVDPRHLERGCVSRCASSPSLVSRSRPGGVGVEPADRVQALAAPRPATTTVGRPCGSFAVLDVAGRLVERVDDVAALERDRLPVDRDRVAVADVARRIAHDLAADRDAAGEHELLGGAARGDAGVGEVLGEAHAAATIGAVDLALLDTTLADWASPPSARARSGAGRRTGAPATTR